LKFGQGAFYENITGVYIFPSVRALKKALFAAVYLVILLKVVQNHDNRPYSTIDFYRLPGTMNG
jgi:hypothetical protein